MKKMIPVIAAAVMLCSCGSGADSSSGDGGSKTQADTLAQRFSDKLDAGEYDIEMRVSGNLYESEMKCHMWGRDGDGCVAMDDGGVHTEFLTVDNETYMLVPDVQCYELFDSSGGFGNTFVKIGKGDELQSSDTKDGKVTEVYTGDGGEVFTFVFDEESGSLKTFTAERESGTTRTEIDSISWECSGVDMPDLSEWADVGESAMVSDVTQLKFSLYIAGGVTEEDVLAAGYTYEQICQMDLDERNKVTDELLGK